MTAKEILAQLKEMGTESTRKILKSMVLLPINMG